MKLVVRNSGKNNKRLYIQKSLRKNGKCTSVIVESLGILADLMVEKNMSEEEVIAWGENRARELTDNEADSSKNIVIKLSQSSTIKEGRRTYRTGQLFLQDIYSKLRFKNTFRNIKSRNDYEYDAEAIFSDLIFSRIIEPGSKRSSYITASTFLEAPKYDEHQVYRALSLFQKEMDYILSETYKNSHYAVKRNNRILYYDCTNYYFEIEEDDDFRKYGHSKEHRPNPIVQLGMFMDASGLPLAFCVNPGNTPETQTMQPLEEKLAANFSLSSFVVCTDGGLGSIDNRMYNMTEGRDYITVLSLKKMRPHLQDWATDPDAIWYTAGHKHGYTLKEAKVNFGPAFDDITFYRDRWTKEEYKDKNGKKRVLEEHLVVTYCHKYALYQRKTRDEQIARAQTKINRGESTRQKSPNDCRRFIKTDEVTADGVVVEHTISTIDWEKVRAEERFDGFYAYGSSLDDHPLHILKANSYRGDIEALYRVTKTDLDLRPIYLSRKDRIIGHFIVCFISLLIIKRLQQSLAGKYSVEKLCDTLRKIKLLYHDAYGYEPAFDRTEVTDDLQQNANILIDTEIITKPTMRKILKQVEKS